MSIEVLLVDDHAIIREGLRSLLEKQQDMEVVADADNDRKGIELVRELSPDVVIMDVTMPGLNGIEATRLIMEKLDAHSVAELTKYAVREGLTTLEP